MRYFLLTLIVLFSYLNANSQGTFSIGTGAAFSSADEAIGSGSEAPARTSMTAYLEPGYVINGRARVNLATHFAFQNKFRSIIFGVDFKSKPEDPFYLGFGLGNVRYQAGGLRLGTFPGSSGVNGDFNTISGLAIAPRMGFRGAFDFNTTFIYYPERSRGFILLNIAYIIGHKKADELSND